MRSYVKAFYSNVIDINGIQCTQWYATEEDAIADQIAWAFATPPQIVFLQFRHRDDFLSRASAADFNTRRFGLTESNIPRSFVEHFDNRPSKN